MYLIVAILIVALLGNSYLFSGYSVEGDVAVFMVGIAVLVDIVIVGYVIWAIYDKIKTGIEEQKRQRIAEEKRNQQEKIDAEKRRLDSLRKRIDRIVSQFKPKVLNWMPAGTSIQVCFEWLNQDVISTVKAYKQSVAKKIEDCKIIDSKINEILGCPGISELEYKLEYLNSKKQELLALKVESDSLHQSIAQTKIKLIDNDTYAIHIMHKAFELMKTSKKCLSEKVKLEDFITTNKPKELSLFSYAQEPIMLNVHEYTYCLFGNVILVFDSNGRFSTAVDPSSLEVTIKRHNADIYISNNSSSFSHEYVDSDSKRVREGKTTSSWLYTCRDGSPDMRRTHNPLIQSRTDTYEYAVITMTINGFQFEFTISSQAAIEALVLMEVEYCKKHNHLHNPSMDLLGLLKLTIGDESSSIDEIIRICMPKQKNSNYFCAILEW